MLPCQQNTAIVIKRKTKLNIQRAMSRREWWGGGGDSRQKK
jgi:hypothetical protein